MERLIQPPPIPIHRFSSKNLIVKAPSRSGMIESLIDALVAHRLIGLRSGKIAGNIVKPIAVEDLAAQSRALCGGSRRRPGGQLRAKGLHARRYTQRSSGRASEIWIATRREAIKQAKGHHKAVRTGHIPVAWLFRHGFTFISLQCGSHAGVVALRDKYHICKEVSTGGLQMALSHALRDLRAQGRGDL